MPRTTENKLTTVFAYMPQSLLQAFQRCYEDEKKTRLDYFSQSKLILLFIREGLERRGYV